MKVKKKRRRWWWRKRIKKRQNWAPSISKESVKKMKKERKTNNKNIIAILRLSRVEKT